MGGTAKEEVGVNSLKERWGVNSLRRRQGLIHYDEHICMHCWRGKALALSM